MRGTGAGRRLVAVAVAAALASSCAHVSPVINNDTPGPIDGCRIDDRCAGGTGAVDGAASIVVASALVGILGFALVRKIIGD